ncbi:MAG: hypothetical protein A2725_00055 [Candidatus Magasanikbacteria bacterium RIFCSPHIGHO2_01_FULL_33_34]|uniref:Heat-inducible transcription repressor HrcA n=1 Tax=Candidatus Magasanikbacteria bacterium RIFCSPHIGHO2_01_FULL_33_34 TaxID=1798671 RepID=A0A1F6LKU8_9BACT|nr:MAG: hypothetical protein A2725_00055 [Candidatus Magasanikbacteria bacterium RIFCSPHIGHO2_01_FULL_33_34]OGH65753.1 MAG: hypothetical protein A3B83_02725 [Candidatus Magasanikbacteria bacterium RIFCSPHIGHO2_02_FULL_33_17]OGH75119.1 MAG: hypothetical protein A3A89_03320 [Candidatus Magasanikbacteria bacterium RIFCSPLOWO2_01_FULL_33_34]OGH81197.1 MAG: hypothetical protein A3F93_04020 [Candidatus Magasanikbacteria bacterium RIFCSPLOWO2_12_FULL_34_7]
MYLYMDSRKEQLLQLIVENYLQTAEPVGSKFLIESAGLDVSGATVRNEMRDLEEQGYLTHPHTSAGRIPTEKGYIHYIENIMKIDDLKSNTKKEIDEIAKSGENVLKEIAKYTAEYLDYSVMVALNHNSIYYTGISNLFSQAEFRNYAHTVSVSTIFDECEERMESLYDVVDDEIKVLVGRNNPLGNACGTVATKIGGTSLFAILGPMRMDYAKSVSILNHIKTIIKNN